MVNLPRLIDLIDELRQLPKETEWVEFKVNNSDPQVIGKRVSALSNGARLKEKSVGYLAYGIENETHNVVGTTFQTSVKVKGQPFEFWLSQRTKIAPSFFEVPHPAGRVVLIEIPAAVGTPTKFDDVAYIRIGEATPKLSDHPQLEKQLWSRLQSVAWEKDVAFEYVTAERVLSMLHHEEFLSLLGIQIPKTKSRILELLQAEGLITPDVGGRWNILNLGACLLARQLADFPRIARKAIRMIEYEDLSRVHAKKEHTVPRGYAVGFEKLIDRIMELTSTETIGSLRLRAQPFPRPAVRELVANALIHQDMTETGAGPMIELFKDRIEITNPGQPLIEPQRFLDMPPKSRNEDLASLMRRVNICEERGSGIDRVIAAVEEGHLPAPDFYSGTGFTRAVLLGPRVFADMLPGERIRACYQHAQLLNEKGMRVTNSTLRARFDVPASNSAHVSRVLKDTKDANLIKLADPSSPKGGYVPFFA